MKQKKTGTDMFVQIFLPVFTLLSQFVIASGNPKIGYAINLLAQPLWLYSSWKAYRLAGQIGLFVISIVLTIIVVWGFINYWFIIG